MTEEQKKEFLRMATYLHNLFMDNDVWYCLAFGSLLGAIRHNGFIPWDRDFDIHIKVNDMTKIRSLIVNHPLPETFFQIRGRNHCTSSHDSLISTRIDGCGLDIYQFIGVPLEKSKRIIFCYICYLADMAFRHKHVKIQKCLPQNRIKASIVKACTQIVPDSFIEYIYKRIESKYRIQNSKYVRSLSSNGTNDCILGAFLERRIMHRFEDTSFMILQDYDCYLRAIYGDYMTPRIY